MYSVPDKSSLIEKAGLSFENGSEEITAEFTLLQSLVSFTVSTTLVDFINSILN